MLIKTNRAKILSLVATIAVITSGVAGTTLWLLYEHAFQNYGDRLKEVASSQSAIIKSIASFNKQLFFRGSDAFSSTIEVLRDANKDFTGIGTTGEFTVAARIDDEIVYYISQRQPGTPSQDQSLFRSTLSEPMQLALDGKYGLIVGRDYRGIAVLAAFEPISNIGLGVVAKVDLAEIRAPFIKAGLMSALAGFTLILFGLAAFFRINQRLNKYDNMAQARYESILDTSIEGIISINRYGIIQSINHSACELFGYNKSELMGKNINLLMPESMRDTHDHYISNVANTGRHTVIETTREVEAMAKNGTMIPIDLSLSQTKLGQNIFFTGIFREATSRKRALIAAEEYREHLEDQVEKRTTALAKANKTLKIMANQDGLTGIANRTVFDKVIKREIRRAIRHKSIVSVVICDIDYFKNYNNTYGHLEGDKCLKDIAKTIDNLFQRASDLVARYSGEEFAVILPGVNYDGLVVVAEQLRQSILALHIKHLAPDGSDRVSISIGAISITPTIKFNDTKFTQSLENSLRQAKENGKNKVFAEQIND